MGVMPERIGKPRILQKLDARYANPALRLIAKNRLLLAASQNKDVADLGAEADSQGNVVFDKPAGDKKHIKEDWFAKGSPGWWGNKHADLILKQGLLTAFEESEKLSTPQKDVPIKTLWICSGPKNSAPFEVYVYPTSEQVTLIIFSPEIPGYLYEQEDETAVGENIWIVKRITHVPGSPGEKKLDRYKKGDVILEMNLGSNLEIVRRKPKPLA